MSYDGIFLAFALAIFSFCTFALAWAMLFMKGYFLSAILSLGTVLMVFLSARGWLSALVSSGKNTRALGYGQYPLVPVAYGVLVLGSLACLVLSLRLLKRRRKMPVEETESVCDLD